MPALEAMGFRRTNLKALGIGTGMSAGAALVADFRERIDRYREARDFPAARGPSYLSVHLRFGTVSIRELVAYAHLRSLEPDGDGAATWLSELIWREFYAQILWHHPHVDRARVQAAVRRAAAFPTTRRCSPRGARDAPATPSSTPRCGRSTRRATCTTGCG